MSYSIQVTTADGLHIGAPLPAPDELDAAMAKTKKAFKDELCIHHSAVDKSKIPDIAILYRDGVEVWRWTYQQNASVDDERG